MGCKKCKENLNHTIPSGKVESQCVALMNEQKNVIECVNLFIYRTKTLTKVRKR